jgi:hypothetical protein
MDGSKVRVLVAVPSMDPMTSSNMRSNVETASHLVSMEGLLWFVGSKRETTIELPSLVEDHPSGGTSVVSSPIP